MLLASPLLAVDPPRHDPKTLLHQASTAYQARQFDKALELYLSCHRAGERTAEVRERIHDCVRQSAQLRRQSDTAFREYVLALPPAEALNLYSEIIQKLSQNYADRDKSRPEQLFALSLQEIERALMQTAFRKQNCPQVRDAQLFRFLDSLRELGLARQPATPQECRTALSELIRCAQSEIALNEPTALVLEAICGACAGLDESTVYVPPMSAKDKGSESSIVRAEIVDARRGVGLIAIKRFRESTPEEFDQAYQRLREAGLKSLVLDLRGNCGGSFAAALRLAERFISTGLLARTIARAEEFRDREFYSASGLAAIAVPLIVLVDGRTMSAAEVFAGAIKDANRGTLIGETTFGKGTVQGPLALRSADLVDDGGLTKQRSGSLMVTVANVVTASGSPLHHQGIVPHIRESEPAQQEQLAMRRAGDLAAAVR